MMKKPSIIFFDGVCNLCNASIDFIIKRDKNNRFLVGALQDAHSRKVLAQYQVNENYLDSLVLLQDGEIHYKSTAALKIAKALSGLWPIFYPLINLPEGFRDKLYDWIASNRYSWFGKKNTCRLPTSEERSKFLSPENYPN
jgi:predicted DCC family thiol-disulfide oxidoreductase YuxK